MQTLILMTALHAVTIIWKKKIELVNIENEKKIYIYIFSFLFPVKHMFKKILLLLKELYYEY